MSVVRRTELAESCELDSRNPHVDNHAPDGIFAVGVTSMTYVPIMLTQQ